LFLPLRVYFAKVVYPIIFDCLGYGSGSADYIRVAREVRKKMQIQLVNNFNGQSKDSKDKGMEFLKTIKLAMRKKKKYHTEQIKELTEHRTYPYNSTFIYLSMYVSLSLSLSLSLSVCLSLCLCRSLSLCLCVL